MQIMFGEAASFAARWRLSQWRAWRELHDIYLSDGTAFVEQKVHRKTHVDILRLISSLMHDTAAIEQSVDGLTGGHRQWGYEVGGGGGGVIAKDKAGRRVGWKSNWASNGQTASHSFVSLMLILFSFSPRQHDH